MYLDTLEERTHELEAKYATQQETMSVIESENKVLKEQLNFLKNLLNGKGQDMAILEKQLHDGFQSTSNPQQSSSIFMFVLFSCFLLFNPMSWFTSTTTTMTQPSHLTSTVHPDTTRYTGRKILGLMDENMSGHHDMTLDMLKKDDENQELSYMSMETMKDIQATSYHYMKTAYMTDSVPMSASSTSIDSFSMSASPSTDASRALITTPSSHSTSSIPHVPCTGSPHDLVLNQKSSIDMDNPIRVYRVAQPVEPETTTVAPTAAAPTIIDLTNTTDNNTSSSSSQHDIHKMAHDQLYVPLVRLMGEQHVQHALQSLAQGVMKIQLENQTETRSSTPITPA